MTIWREGFWKRRKMRARAELDLVSAIEGHFASELLLGLLRAGILKLLDKPWSVEDLALASGVEKVSLKQALDYLAGATSVVLRVENGRYRLGEPGFAELAFQIEKFIGAYGVCIRNTGTSHRARKPRQPADQNALAAAFSYTAGAGSPIATYLLAAGISKMVELGCGSEPLSVQMALQDADFEGLCIDSSAPMCRLAARRILAAGVRPRVRVERARAQDLCAAISASERKSCDTVYGRSILNTLFGGRSNEAVLVLAGLRRAFPGRRAFFIDYYSEWPAKDPKLPARRVARLQDLAQLASGQGLPPIDRKVWAGYYRDAGCRLIATKDFDDKDIRWFIHEVRL